MSKNCQNIYILSKKKCHLKKLFHFFFKLKKIFFLEIKKKKVDDNDVWNKKTLKTAKKMQNKPLKIEKNYQNEKKLPQNCNFPKNCQKSRP